MLAHAPTDPSVLDVVRFCDSAERGAGSWSFGDGTSGPVAEHRYAADGDYTVSHTVATADGGTTTSTLVVHVRTHDVAIAKLSAPEAARAGETCSISVTVSNAHYPETVEVQLLKESPTGWSRVGAGTQVVDAGSSGPGTEFAFSYTFTPDDAAAGRVGFRAIATIEGARDAYPADNDVTAATTTVNGPPLASIRPFRQRGEI